MDNNTQQVHKGKHAAPAGAHVSKEQAASMPARSRAKKPAVVALTVVLLVLLAIGGAGVAWMVTSQSQLDQAAKEAAKTPRPENPPKPAASDDGKKEAAKPALPENPINFKEQQAANEEIYAWVYIPGTDVNVPILRSATDDNYYLTHNVKRQVSAEGAAFTQSMNSMDFKDPVTLVYGHQVSNNTMFTTLHNFENEEFFAKHSEMLIYLPGKVLTYKIVSAYQYDDRHIMNSFDFSDKSVRKDYFKTVMQPQSMLVNVRQDVKLTSKSKIVQLSTCMDAINVENTRYIVTGVLVDEQKTK